MKYLIALIALLLPTYLVRFDMIGGIPTTLLEVLIYVIFFYGLITLAYSQMLRVKRRIWLPIGFLLFGLLAAFYVSPDKLAALGQVKAFFIDPLLVFWLITCYLEPKDFRWVIGGLGGSSLFVSIYTIVEKFLNHTTPDGRVIGIFGYSPNYVALYLAPIMVILISYGLALFFKKNYLMFVLASIIFLINAIALYLTGSRSGMLAVLGGLATFLIFYFWPQIQKRLVLKIGLAILIIAALIGAWFTFRPNFNAGDGRVTSSNNVRWQIWGASIELGQKQPLWGVGLANYQNAFTNLTQDRGNFKEYIIPQALTPHNLFLMFWLSVGLLGITAFIWLLVTFYYIGFKNLKSDWSKILLAAMTALLLQGLVDTPYFKNDLSLIFWLIFAFMILLSSKKETI